MAGDELMRLTSADSEPEAEMIAALLAESGIQCLIQRPAGFDVPYFLSGGPRELMVRSEDHERATEIVAAHFGLR